MEASSSNQRPDVPGNLLESVKRQTIPSACQNCRRKKVRCDGGKPCGYCSRRNLECIFENDPRETHHQSRKRKLNELSNRTEDFQRLFNSLAGQDEARAVEIFGRIRGGENIESLFRLLQTGNMRQQEIPYESTLKRLFLFSLIQSNGPLQEVVSLASSFLSNNRINLPPVSAYERLQDRIVTLDVLGGILSSSNPESNIEAPLETASTVHEDGSAYILWVPAEPWVPGGSDAKMSHLVSLFFSYLNHSWRHVEQAPFLSAMRSRDTQSRYCSPLLVNAILAMASLHSDSPNEDLPPEQVPERGLEYHNETLRLWNLEESKQSLTNLQALIILSVESILRGKDVLGMNLLSSATNLNDMLPLPQVPPANEKDDFDYAQSRACAWWTCVHVDLTYKAGMLFGSDTTDWNRAPVLDLPETTIYWHGYPLIDKPIPFKHNSLFQHRNTFTRLLWEATRILVWDSDRLVSRRILAEAVHELSERMQHWYSHLPSDLHFADQMPPSLYDLHVQYYCVQMMIHERAFVQMFGPLSNRATNADVLDIADESLKEELRTRTLDFLYGGATFIRHFREHYGLKVASFIHLNHSVMGVFIALNSLHSNPPLQQRGPNSTTGPVRDTQSALEEFFRVLLATSLRWTMSRGFSRTAYHSAQALHVRLPDNIAEMLRIMSGVAWQPSDLKQLDKTAYPNWSMPRVRKAQAEDFRMGDMLERWEGTPTQQEEFGHPVQSSFGALESAGARSRETSNDS